MRSLLFYLIGDSVIEGLHSRLSYRFGVVDGEFRKGRKFARMELSGHRTSNVNIMGIDHEDDYDKIVIMDGCIDTYDQFDLRYPFHIVCKVNGLAAYHWLDLSTVINVVWK